MSQILFEDIFDVKGLNENGKKFDRGSLFWFRFLFIVYIQSFLLNVVDRLHCKGTTYDVDLVLGKNFDYLWLSSILFYPFCLDINAELFSLKIGERISVTFAR
jgi:hypothetical protein